MKKHRLYVRFESSAVGVLDADNDGVLVFIYEASWLKMKSAFPLSIALELKEGFHRGPVVEAFFENLIPEGNHRRQLEILAGLAEDDDIQFLQRFGEDCAGALTISTTPQPTTRLMAKDFPEVQVSFDAIERAIAEGLPIQSILTPNGELPPFSLAGAQAKFPCVLRDDLIVMPKEGEPTSHIIKLPIRAGNKLLDSVQNEYLCTRMAAAIGFEVPTVALVGDKIPLFAIKRFDRTSVKGRTKRIHAQDFCQALGKTSREKYEQHGGPSFADCYRLLGNESKNIAHDQIALLDWLAFNLAIGNNDSHAKNISLLLSGSGIFLAPFYDLVCTTVYKQYSDQFAFKIGETYNWQRIRMPSIDALARSLRIKPSFVCLRWLDVFNKIEAIMPILEEEISYDQALIRTFRKITKEVKPRIKALRKNIS